MLMEYVEGQNLQQLLEEEHGFELQKILEWGLALCRLFAFLHSQGITYCDLKPSNLLLSADNTLHLVDFGAICFHRKPQTKDTVYLGTKGYAAPELFGGMGRQMNAVISILSVPVFIICWITAAKIRGCRVFLRLPKNVRPTIRSAAFKALFSWNRNYCACRKGTVCICRVVAWLLSWCWQLSYLPHKTGLPNICCAKLLFKRAKPAGMCVRRRFIRQVYGKRCVNDCLPSFEKTAAFR